MNRWRSLFLFGSMMATILVVVMCSSPSVVETTSPFLNTNDSVRYVGMQTCRGCHQDVFNTFIKTGMGQSWDYATLSKSKAVFDKHTYIYDSSNTMWYHPYWQKDSLYICEFRLQGKDTIHKRIEKISYIVGSGQHTNSHLIYENGYLTQAPLTFYTQQGIWDLPPGFENGKNTRFSRIVGQECITCHNHFPETDFSAENKFSKIKTGIECERCHGPGSLHVSEKQKGNLVDIKTQTDYTIVNPKKLPRDLQLNVCQRCHLQGITVLETGKSFYDYRPGKKLSASEHSFLPRYTDSAENFIMASQADRMKMSKCFKQSQMTCLSCRNPHVSVKETLPEKFVNDCKSCHQQNTCTEKPAVRRLKNDNCITCHMPMSGSIDIPHVQIHDHYIRIPKSNSDKKEIRKFVRLANLSDETPTALVQAKAYLQFYEEYEPYSAFLDSAFTYLNKSKAAESLDDAFIHAYYLQNNFDQVIHWSKKMKLEAIINDWTAYRIGESYLQNNQAGDAERYFRKAVALKPNELDYLNKLGVSLLEQKKSSEALSVFNQVLSKYSKHVSALTNVGFIKAQDGKLAEAEADYIRALQLNPDYEPTLMNLAALYLLENKQEPCRKILKRILQLNKSNSKAAQLLSQLKTI